MAIQISAVSYAFLNSYAYGPPQYKVRHILVYYLFLRKDFCWENMMNLDL